MQLSDRLRSVQRCGPTGLRMDFSKSAESVAVFTKDSSKWIELSKKLRKLHHSSKMAVLSSCCAN